MNKKSFVIYCDIGDQLELLTDEQVGVLFRSVVKYASNEEELSSNDGMVKLLFFGNKETNRSGHRKI